MLPELEQAAKDNFKRELGEIRAEILTLEATLTSAVPFGEAATEEDPSSSGRSSIRKRDVKRRKKTEVSDRNCSVPDRKRKWS